MRARVRYALVMLWLALIAVLASAPQNAAPQPTRAVVQAQATVRIISGTRVSLSGDASEDAPAPSNRIVHTDGVARTVRLVEFQ